MNCPRCGGTLEVYRLGDGESRSCQDCQYVGIEVEHASEGRRSESWDDALERFRTHATDRRVSSDGDTASPGDDDSNGSDPIRALDLPGTGETLERRYEALRTLYELLEAEGSATRSDFLDVVDVEGTGYASTESFWSNAGRPGLRELPDVHPPEDGHHEWRIETHEA